MIQSTAPLSANDSDLLTRYRIITQPPEQTPPRTQDSRCIRCHQRRNICRPRQNRNLPCLSARTTARASQSKQFRGRSLWDGVTGVKSHCQQQQRKILRTEAACSVLRSRLTLTLCRRVAGAPAGFPFHTFMQSSGSATGSVSYH